MLLGSLQDDEYEAEYGVLVIYDLGDDHADRPRPRSSQAERWHTILVLISDLYEGGDVAALLSRLGALRAAGVCVLALLALSDDGAPSYDAVNAPALAELGIPAFACTPDVFPDLLAVAIEGGDVGAWAQRQELAVRGR